MKRASKLLVIALLIATLAVVGVTFGGDRYEVQHMNSQSLAGATGWLNSRALTPADLRGKVVVVQFWTYTCINWLRTLSFVRAWAERYADKGLVVIGVHAPEFPFEHDAGNVRRAVEDLKIEYPVALDNDFAVWQAFDNHVWPALYIIDAKGRIRHTQLGEGKYEESERIIRELLAEAGHGELGARPAAVDGRGVEAQADWASLGSPETYVGRAQARGFASLGRKGQYSIPASLALNDWALSGNWTVTEWAASLNEPGGRIAYRFHARDLHLVMGPGSRGGPARFRVLIDGKPPGAAHGTDVDEHGNGAVTEPRLYQLIRQSGPIADRLFEIELLDPGVQIFAFTFG